MQANFLVLFLCLLFGGFVDSGKRESVEPLENVEVLFRLSGENQPLENCWVWLPTTQNKNPDLIRKFNPEEASNLPAAVIEKKNGKLVPSHLILRTEQKLIFFNSSSESWSPIYMALNEDLSMNIGSGDAVPRELNATIRPVLIKDDIDHEISGTHILVIDHPYAKFFEADAGKMGLPTGDWEIAAFHPNEGFPSKVFINDDKPISYRDFRRKTISVSGQLNRITFEWNQE